MPKTETRDWKQPGDSQIDPETKRSSLPPNKERMLSFVCCCVRIVCQVFCGELRDERCKWKCFPDPSGTCGIIWLLSPNIGSFWIRRGFPPWRKRTNKEVKENSLFIFLAKYGIGCWSNHKCSHGSLNVKGLYLHWPWMTRDSSRSMGTLESWHASCSGSSRIAHWASRSWRPYRSGEAWEKRKETNTSNNVFVVMEWKYAISKNDCFHFVWLCFQSTQNAKTRHTSWSWGSSWTWGPNYGAPVDISTARRTR